MLWASSPPDAAAGFSQPPSRRAQSAASRRIKFNVFRRCGFGHGTSAPFEGKGALLLADPEFFTAIVLGAKTKIEIEPSGIKFAAFPKLDYSKIEVWTAKALQKENEDADETQKIIIDLTKVINRRDDEEEADQSRKSLLSRPLISQALQRLSRQSSQ